MIRLPLRKFHLSRCLRSVGAAILVSSLMVIWNGRLINNAATRTGRSLMWSSEKDYFSQRRRISTGCDVMKDDDCIEAKLEKLFKVSRYYELIENNFWRVTTLLYHRSRGRNHINCHFKAC